MKKVEFRRNLGTPLRGTTLRRRSIMLIIAVVCIVVFAVTLPRQLRKIPEKAVVKISFLTENRFLVGADTTNYDEFASILMKNVQSYGERPVELWLMLPKEHSFRQVSDIVQVANAIQGVTMRLYSER